MREGSQNRISCWRRRSTSWRDSGRKQHRRGTIAATAHAWQLEQPGGREVALDQAAFESVPAFHPHRRAAFFHLVDRGGAVFRAESRQGPARGIEHSHTALPIHHDDYILEAGIAGSGDVQDIFGLLQKTSHEKLIGRARTFFESLTSLARPRQKTHGKPLPASFSRRQEVDLIVMPTLREVAWSIEEELTRAAKARSRNPKP